MRPRRPVLFISSERVHPLPPPPVRSSTPLPFISFQSLPNCPICKSFVLKFIQMPGGCTPLLSLVYPCPLLLRNLGQNRSLFSTISPLFHFPYTLTPFFATLTKTAGVWGILPILERSSHMPEIRRSSRITRHGTRVSVHRLSPRLRPLTDHGPRVAVLATTHELAGAVQ
jgi:hypothetical protein